MLPSRLRRLSRVSSPEILLSVVRPQYLNSREHAINTGIYRSELPIGSTTGQVTVIAVASTRKPQGELPPTVCRRQRMSLYPCKTKHCRHRETCNSSSFSAPLSTEKCSNVVTRCALYVFQCTRSTSHLTLHNKAQCAITLNIYHLTSSYSHCVICGASVTNKISAARHVIRCTVITVLLLKTVAARCSRPNQHRAHSSFACATNAKPSPWFTEATVNSASVCDCAGCTRARHSRRRCPGGLHLWYCP